MRQRSGYFGSAALAVAALLLVAQPSARAFTIDNNSGTNSDGSPKFTDPDEEVQNFGRSGSGSGSGPQFFFGTQSSDQARNRWSNPATRPLSPDSSNLQGNSNYRD